MEAGREFHKREAEHEKDLSPKYFVFAFFCNICQQHYGAVSEKTHFHPVTRHIQPQKRNLNYILERNISYSQNDHSHSNSRNYTYIFCTKMFLLVVISYNDMICHYSTGSKRKFRQRMNEKLLVACKMYHFNASTKLFIGPSY